MSFISDVLENVSLQKKNAKKSTGNKLTSNVNNRVKQLKKEDDIISRRKSSIAKPNAYTISNSQNCASSSNIAEQPMNSNEIVEYIKCQLCFYILVMSNIKRKLIKHPLTIALKKNKIPSPPFQGGRDSQTDIHIYT